MVSVHPIYVSNVFLKTSICMRNYSDIVVSMYSIYFSNPYNMHLSFLQLCQFPDYKDRRLDQRERPLEVKAEWPKDRRAEYVFVLRRNMTQALSLRKVFLSLIFVSNFKRLVIELELGRLRNSSVRSGNLNWSRAAKIFLLASRGRNLKKKKRENCGARNRGFLYLRSRSGVTVPKRDRNRFYYLLLS